MLKLAHIARMSYDFVNKGCTLIQTLHMKSPLLTCVALLATVCLHAQFSLLPQIGFEQSRATLGYNSFSTSGVEGNLRASLRADYRFKAGHGPFINLGTNPAPMSFAFRNDGSLDESFKASDGSLQFRMEAGYQYTSKPIQLKKTAAAAKPKAAPGTSYQSGQRKTCGAASYKPQCGEKKVAYKQAPVNKALNMRLQPSLALAYLSANNQKVAQRTNGYSYVANAWNTALVPAMAVEFGKGAERLFTLTVFYTKPLDLQSENVSSMSGSKPVITAMNPKASAWGMTIGVPISLSKKPTPQKVVQPLDAERPQIKQYSYKKCSRTIRL